MSNLVYNTAAKHTHVTNLRLSDKYPMVFLTGEVALPLDSSIVLAFRLIKYDTNPFSRGEESGTDVGHSATLTFPGHLYYGANLEEKRQIHEENSQSAYTLVFIPFFITKCNNYLPLEVCHSPLFLYCSFC